jgi:hypothetical protein
MILRRCLVIMAVIATTLTWPAPMTASTAAAGGTTVSVNGDTVNITVNIDLVLDRYLSAQLPLSDADRQKFGELASAISDYWNKGLGNYPYRGCLHLHVDVVINILTSHQGVSIGYPFDSSDAGHHLIHWRGNLLYSANTPGGDPVYTYSRPTVYDPTRPAGQPGDYPSPYQTGLPGDWSPSLETTRDYAHEVGHLMGLDDDYHDVQNGDGTWSSQSNSGREGTLMDSGDTIDQNLADRLGDVIGQAGIKLPECWTGTLTTQLEQPVPSGTQYQDYSADVVVTETAPNALTGSIAGHYTQRLTLTTCPSDTTTPGTAAGDLSGNIDSTGMHLTLVPGAAVPPTVTPCPGAGPPGVMGNPLGFPQVADLLGKLEPQGNGRYAASMDVTVPAGQYPFRLRVSLTLSPLGQHP